MNLQKQSRMGAIVPHQNTFPFGKNTSSVTISQLVPKMRISRLEVIVLEKGNLSIFYYYYFKKKNNKFYLIIF